MTYTGSCKTNPIEAEIYALAAKHGVTYVATELDKLADVYARLSDNDVELDELGCLILALQRAGHLTSKEATQLHGRYLRVKYNDY